MDCMTSARPAPVVVAVDDAGSADDALLWAAAEAAARRSPLRVVHALDSCLTVDPACIRETLEQSDVARSSAVVVLRDAAARAVTVASDLEITTRVLDGRAAGALRHEAREAQLLVLGQRAGRRGTPRLFTSSVSGGLAAHAGCPVVVLRALDSRPASAACVVVGVDGGSSCTSAIRFAFQSASQRGVPVRIVHVDRNSYGSETLADTSVVRTLSHWHEEFPDVPVVAKLLGGDPATALIEEGSGAALLVVGSRGRRIGRSLGAVAQTVLDNARCPVAVVRHGAVLPAPAGAVDDPRPQRHIA